MQHDWLQRDGEDLLLAVHVQPNARHDAVDGLHGDRLKLRISAPPADGRANRQLVRYLAGLFGITRNRVVLVSGENARTKRLRIRGITELPQALAALITHDFTAHETTR